MAETLIELLRSLNANGVEYAIVGGHAVMFHGYPRSTQDLDILYRPSRENAERLARVISAYVAGATPEDFLGPADEFIALKIHGEHVDLLPAIAGVQTDEVLRSALPGVLFGESTPFIDRASLLINKRATGRLKDAADAEELERVGSPGTDT
jgi:hypothetical protein